MAPEYWRYAIRRANVNSITIVWLQMMLSSFNELLQGASNNPYLQQMRRGHTWLRFSAELEQQYRAEIAQEAIRQRRIAIVLAVFIWLGFVVFDLLRLPLDQGLSALPEDAWKLLGVRVGVLLVLLLGQLLVIVPRFEPLTLWLTPWVIALCGVVTGIANMLYHRMGIESTYEGVILLVIAAFFPLGIGFFNSLRCALAIVLGNYVAAVYLLTGANFHAFHLTAIYLLLAVLVCAGGGYLRDYSQREQFLAQQMLHWLAARDSLTSLRNRRSFDLELTRLLAQARREQRKVGLLLVDVDHFKLYNDHYGHQAGDEVLRRLGAVLDSFARRPMDLAVRLGGEEFALLLYGVDEHSLSQLAEELRVAVQNLQMTHQGSPTAAVVTVSSGWALGVGDTPEGLYQRADQALYKAKDAGRNQVFGARLANG